MSVSSAEVGDIQDFVAIDFGGHRMKAFYVKDGKASMILDPQQNKYSPTIITFLDKIRSWGSAANFTENAVIIERIKDFFEADYHSKLKSQKFLIDPIVNNNGKVGFEVKFGDSTKILSPIALLGFMINEICCWSPDSTVSDVAIVVPYWYTEKEKIAVKTACAIYDKHVFMISNTQAQVYDYITRHTSHTTQPHVAAFIDFGFTHFDCSAYLIQEKSIRMLSRGKIDIGGRDITFALCDYILSRIEKEIKKPDVQSVVKQIKHRPNSPDAIAFRAAVKNLKENLSSSNQMAFHPLGVTNGDQISLKVEKDELEKLPIMQDLSNKITALIKEVRTGIAGKGKLNSVFIQGGSSKMPIVKRIVATSFGLEESKVNLSRPEECFAEGAALYHAKKRRHPKNREEFKLDEKLVQKLKQQEDEINLIAENEFKAMI